MKRKIRNVLLILFGSVALGLLLLTIIFSLPVDTVKVHVEESLYDMIDVVRDEHGNAWRKKIISAKDSFTDYLMVQNAMEKIEGQSALAHAIYVFHYDLKNEQTWTTEESLVASLKSGTEGMFLREYARYWHGYLIWLKPLLMCMSWSQAEIFLMVFQMVLLLSVVAVSIYRKKAYLGIGVVVTLAFMKPLGIWASFTLMTCWTITLFALLVELLWYDQIREKDWQEEFFLLIGIVTAYMDFLTYPIITLGMPLCFYIVQNMDENTEWWNKIKKIFQITLSWGIGYIGMWGMKWLVADLLFQTGTIRNAIWSVIFRTEPLDGYASTFTGISRTLDAILLQFDSTYYWIAFGCIGIAALGSAIWCLTKARSPKWGISVIALLLIGLYPFVWLIFTQNHTAIHCSYTFRIMGTTIMAIWCIGVCSVKACNYVNHS